MNDSLIKNLRDLAAFAHADLSVADEAADEIERLREALQMLSNYGSPAPRQWWAEDIRRIALVALGEEK